MADSLGVKAHSTVNVVGGSFISCQFLQHSVQHSIHFQLTEVYIRSGRQFAQNFSCLC